MTTRSLLLLSLLFVACPPVTPPQDACAPNPCLGDRSVCTMVDGAATCSCRQGFDDVSGVCVMAGPCTSNPCTQANRTVCVASGTTAICQCDSGFRDDGTGACVRAQSCSQNPCTQPGRTVCSEAQGVVTCSCAAGLRDDGMGGCVSENPCASNPCTQPNRTVCVASGTTAVCQCDQGFLDDGSGACVAAPSCTPNPCTMPNRTQCSVSGTTVTCACDPGYRLDALGQCVSQQACTPNPCTQPNRGVCTESSGVAVCGCNVGFHDEAGTCVRNDLCAPNPCTLPNQGVCTAQADAGVSCACNPGYQPGANGCELVPPPTCANQHAGDAYEPDECPALARPIVAGVAQSRTFSPAGDVEFVTFSADGGTVLLAEETGALATYLTLYDSDGTTALWANQSERMQSKLPHDGTYYLQLRAQSGTTTGASTLQVSFLADDQPDTRETATTTLAPTDAGTVLAGRFDFVSDTDCVVVPVQAHRVYQLEETTAVDVYQTVFTQTGTLIGLTDLEVLRFETTTTEPLYLCIRAYTASNLAAWGLKVTDLGVDDQADDRATTTTLPPVASPGATLAGHFEYPGDTDCVAVPVQANRVYTFEEATATDVYQTLYTSTGVYIGLTDAESVRFESTSAQTLYLCVRAYSSTNLAAWTLRVIDHGVDDHPDDATTSVTTVTPLPDPGALIGGAFDYPGDIDCFTVPVQANRIYSFSETLAVDIYQAINTSTGVFIGLTDAESVRFETTAAQSLYVCVRAYSSSTLAPWSMRVIDYGVDDHPDDAMTSVTTVTPLPDPGALIGGAFDYPGDIDCFTVPVQANRIYAFGETLAVDIYQVVNTSTGVLIGLTDSELVRFETTTAQPLYVCVRAFASSTLAPWSMRIIDVGVDDQPDTATTTTATLTPTATLAGAFDVAADVDCVAVPVVAGRVYGFAETAAVDIYQSLVSATATVQGLTDSEAFRMKASTTETLSWCVLAYASSTLAPWSLTVTDYGPDDHGDDRASATPLAIDALPVAGEVQLGTDVDFFTFNVTSVLALRVVTTGIGTSVQVQSSTGAVIASGTGPGTLAFAAPSSGTYFVRVAASVPSSIGAYTVAVGN